MPATWSNQGWRAGDGGNPAEEYRLDFYVKRDNQTSPDWQDLTVNESTLHGFSRFQLDPRYWQPGRQVYEATPQAAQEKVRTFRPVCAANECLTVVMSIWAYSVVVVCLLTWHRRL